MYHIFKNSKEWETKYKDHSGLPRPYKIVSEEVIKNLYNEFKYRLAKKIPIPWQSKPILKGLSVFNVIYENEERVIPENLCGYCGIKIKDDEYVIRWTDKKMSILNDHIEEPRVSSDTMPMHIECMRQARIFCPHMQKTKDSEFEYGDFITLKNNGLKDIEDIKNTPTN